MGISYQFFDIELEDDEETAHICYCLDKDNCICYKTINVLSKHENIILVLIDKISDPEKKKDYYTKLKHTFETKITYTTLISQSFNFFRNS